MCRFRTATPTATTVFLSDRKRLSQDFNLEKKTNTFYRTRDNTNNYGHKATMIKAPTKKERKLLRPLFFLIGFKINLMGISKALRSLLILLLLNITFFFGHVTPGATAKPCPPSPTKQATTKCPRDTLKFGVCGSWLGLVREVIGTPPSQECCSLIKGLADFEAAVCLCTALKTSILGVLRSKFPLLSLCFSTLAAKMFLRDLSANIIICPLSPLINERTFRDLEIVACIMYLYMQNLQRDLCFG
ncbi:Bifunctional inhibitor/plant lipid transfer protein/seed storage helical domain superfamily [Arabidopsis thaliana x Arabidopsis arenosa]|uniref:Bifunctional inhibitor/plant lipid transfer protein/seed storage helical domain superfamily n=1 Tax=Arabidopsis thaliana x Arabidopsis arenosa TaxID=1240361 RepID=A0A8T1Z4Z8_9BRAS|nr:Bifunctional inhibitor/plant lipid transfer protein/seed storage helical domain superfamily [Arabidopsis thaliana x Arabidopsis arenosa]